MGNKIQKISQCLWFDHQAEEAVRFYSAIFKNSRVLTTARVTKTTSAKTDQKIGSVLTLQFQLEGHEFLALNGGPYFKFTPAISFYVACETEKEIDEIHAKLSAGGTVLMPLNKYPFSPKFAWVADKFGLSWQLNLQGRADHKITPYLLFVGPQHGKCEEAMKFYTSIFKNSKIDHIARYGANENGEEGRVKHGRFVLDGQPFIAMESNMKHDFNFNEAVSIVVTCETQNEIDELWDKLTAGGQAVECGWLKDKFGVSWQIVPACLRDLLKDGDEKTDRVMAAVLEMKKLDIATLKSAHAGE